MRENQWIQVAKEIRCQAPGVGSIKLHKQLSEIFGAEHMIGRDAFIKLLRKKRWYYQLLNHDIQPIQIIVLESIKI